MGSLFALLHEQAVEIIDEVGDMLKIKYSSLPVPEFSEEGIQLVEVSI